MKTINNAYKVELLNDDRTILIKAHRFYKQEKTQLGWSNPFSNWCVLEYVINEAKTKYVLSKKFGFKVKEELLRYIRTKPNFEIAYKKLIETKTND